MKCKAILCAIVLLFLVTLAEAGRWISPRASCEGGSCAAQQESTKVGWPWTPSPKPAPVPAPVPAPAPAQAPVPAVVDVPVVADVSAPANLLARATIGTVHRSVAVAKKIAAGPVRVAAKLGNVVRNREHKPVARLVGRLVRR